jgi:hypothetical protein
MTALVNQQFLARQGKSPAEDNKFAETGATAPISSPPGNRRLSGGSGAFEPRSGSIERSDGSPRSPRSDEYNDAHHRRSIDGDEMSSDETDLRDPRPAAPWHQPSNLGTVSISSPPRSPEVNLPISPSSQQFHCKPGSPLKSPLAV